MKKSFTIWLASLVLITSTISCGKKLTDNTNQKPINIIDKEKAFGFTSLYPSAYKSLGSLAKIADSSGKNHVIELDNSLTYKYQDKNISYYSFRAGVKISRGFQPDFYLDSKNITKLTQPTEAEATIMKQDGLRNTGLSTVPAVFNDESKKTLAENGFVFWQSDSLAENEYLMSFLIRADLVPSPRDTKEKPKLRLKMKTGSDAEEYLELVKSPLHIATIGDSVMWGQGMSEEEHLMTKISKKLETDKNQIVRLVNYARSGARLGDPDDNKDINVYGEIPSSSPTINAQLKRLIKEYKPLENKEIVEDFVAPERVDLLVSDAGINNLGSSYILLGLDIRKFNVDKEQQDLVNDHGTIDINNKNIKLIAEKVFNVLKSADIGNKKLKDEINKVYCYNEQANNFSLCNTTSNYANFLDAARRNLPNAQILTMGYFPLLTKDSSIQCDAPININNVEEGRSVSINLGSKGVVGMLTYLLIEPKLGEKVSLVVSGLVSTLTAPISEIIKNNSVQRSVIWTNQSNLVLNRAVEITNNKKDLNGRGSVRFVPISQKFDKNAIFTKDSYIWGFENNKCQKDDLVFPPEDLVLKKRMEECDKYYKEKKGSPYYCYRASLFHPNTKGFDNGYLPEIVRYLENNGLLSRDDI